jgi:alpha-acetolactate decarboxylase
MEAMRSQPVRKRKTPTGKPIGVIAPSVVHCKPLRGFAVSLAAESPRSHRGLLRLNSACRLGQS